MPGLSVFVIVLVIPLAVVIGNGLVRWLFGSPQSAAADLILAMIVFDAAVSVQAHDFQAYVTPDIFKQNLSAIYMGLVIVNFFIWIASAFRLEPSMLSHFDFTNRRYTKNPAPMLFASYLISAFVLVSNILVFTYGK